MSHLLSLAQGAGSGGVLPSVKCSNCSKSVSLAMLSEHVCHQRPARVKTLLPDQPGPRSHTQKPQPLIVMPPASNMTPHSPFPSPLPRPIDYPSGGQGGMAGVGRRAFLAVASPTAMQHHPYHQEPQNGYSGPPSGMQGRRPFQPQLLDTAGTTGRGTPPLSPNSAVSSPRSHSPHSPLPQFPIYNMPAIAKSRTPSPPRKPMPSTRSRALSNASRSPPSRTILPPMPSTPSTKLPFFQKYKDTHGQAQTVPPALLSKDSVIYPRVDPIPPLSPTDSEYSGLAYDVKGDESDNDHTSPISPSNYSGASTIPFVRDGHNSASPRRSHTQPTTGPRGGSGGVASPLGPASHLRMGATRSASDARSAKSKELASRLRVCVRCEIKIENGRWIKMDSGKSVLCERCWKSMYLPKCRRCDKSIEEAAIYSSDGQLKGKYHRECFTCSTCHKPFPDKSFYVYDGRPMCAFHYHQENRSLCVGAACGKPIEGPCAITYAGDRYHPQCLRCGHAGCDERLEDYWEVDGMMLCERHAHRHEQEQEARDEDEDEEGEDRVGELGQFSSLAARPGARRLGSGESRGQKRTTQLINLSGAGFRF